MWPTADVCLLKLCRLYIESKTMTAGAAPGHVIFEGITWDPATVARRVDSARLAEAGVA